MPKLLDRMFMESKKTEFDFFSNTLNRDFPRGLDIEIVKKNSFMKLHDLSLTIEELEHVTLGFHNHRDLFKLINYSEGRNLAKYRFVDSRAALAIPIQSYFVHATVASKVRPTTLAPVFGNKDLQAIVKDL